MPSPTDFKGSPLSSTSRKTTPTTSMTSSNSSLNASPTPIAEKDQKQSKNNDPKRLTVFSTLFGECLALQCADFHHATSACSPVSTDLNDDNNKNSFNDTRSSTELSHSSSLLLPSSPKSQFIRVDGAECIALGRVESELTSKQRVEETVKMLVSRTERVLSVGYLVDEKKKKKKKRKEEGGEGMNGESEEGDSSKKKFARSVVNLPLELYEKNYPGDLEQTMSRTVITAVKHLKQNEFREALKCFEKILAKQKNNPQKDDNRYKVGMTLHNMGVIHLLDGRGDDALPVLEQAVEAKREAFGHDHPEVAVSLDEIGIQYFAKQKFDEALSIFNESKKIQTSALGPDHPKVAMVLNNLACVHFQMRNSVASLATFQEARDIQRNALGSSAKADLDLLHVATTLCNLGYMKLRLKAYEEAQAVFEEALMVQRSVLGDNHKTIEDTLSNIAFTNAFHC